MQWKYIFFVFKVKGVKRKINSVFIRQSLFFHLPSSIQPQSSSSLQASSLSDCSEAYVQRSTFLIKCHAHEGSQRCLPSNLSPVFPVLVSETFLTQIINTRNMLTHQVSLPYLHIGVQIHSTSDSKKQSSQCHTSHARQEEDTFHDRLIVCVCAWVGVLW